MWRLPESTDVLRVRNFRLLLSGQAVSVLGDGVVAVAMAFAVLELGGSPAALGLVLASGGVALVATLLAGGVVADRVSRRVVMVAADLVRLASQGTMAALVIAGVAEVWMLAALSAVTGAGSGYFYPASSGLLPTVVAAEQLQQANGLRAAATSAGEIVGPLVGGLIVATAGSGWALAIDSVTFAISAAFLWQVRTAGEVSRDHASFLGDLRDGWNAFRSRTWVWTVVAYAAVGNMLWAAWVGLGPVVADRHFGGAAAWGTVLAASGVGALAGGLLATSAAPRRPLVVDALTSAIFAVPLAFLAVTVPLPLLASAALVSGGAMMIGNSVWESTLQRHIPGESLSRVSSYDWFGSMAFFPLGLALWGPTADALGFGPTLWLAFGFHVAATAALLAVPDVRRLPAYPEAE